MTDVNPCNAADTEYAPAVRLAVNPGAVATPVLPVATEALTPAPANVPPGAAGRRAENHSRTRNNIAERVADFCRERGCEFRSFERRLSGPAPAATVAAAAGDSTTVCVACSAEFPVSLAVIDCEPLVFRVRAKTCVPASAGTKL